MLELSGEHIAKLNDGQLRLLVARLARSELRRNQQPVSGVTAGGHQDAPDGGVDVRVSVDSGARLDFVPRPLTGFQVKATDMTPAKILAEMCPAPAGHLLDSIRQIVSTRGAYIIVSSKGSVSDAPLLKRRAEMAKAIASAPGAAEAYVDFYDRNRLADWCREYSGIDLWVREQIGDPLSKWRSFANWSGGPVDAAYLSDDFGRVVARSRSKSEAMSASDGIQAIRTALTQPGSIVRLVGLSGVGKTRLVEALFDERSGKDPLDSGIVMYADAGSEPNPTPRDLLYRLKANESRAVVVVDNCNPTHHRELSKVLSESESRISLLTIEYDVGADEPEETDVFELTPSSDEVVVRLLERVATHVSQVDRQTIVEFSGGNARIAIALARTLKTGESLGVIKDADLFKRLFVQGNAVDQALLEAAQALSLVYSFEGEPDDLDGSELSALASLTGATPQSLYKHVSELGRRDLVQTRSRWRAVLPHALANTLASEALGLVPRKMLIDTMSMRPRLLKSFSRRLGLLHSDHRANEIARAWLAEGGQLADPTTFEGDQLDIFLNVAPLAPDQALKSISRAMSLPAFRSQFGDRWSNRSRWLSAAHSLAYDAQTFDEAATLTLEMVSLETGEQSAASSDWRELFHIILSGTLAPPAQRAAFLRRVLAYADETKTRLCIEAVGAMLESAHFSSSHDFRFGARPRGYGWEPDTLERADSWYTEALAIFDELYSAKPALRANLRETLEPHLRPLFANIPSIRGLTDLLVRVNSDSPWPQAWIAVRMALSWDAAEMAAEAVSELRALADGLQPVGLAQEIRTFVMSERYGVFDLAEIEGTPTLDVINAGDDRMAQRARDLGVRAASSMDVVEVFLPELLTKADGMQYAFGQGVADAVADISATWLLIGDAFDQVPDVGRQTSFLCGFVDSAFARDPDTTSRLLDDAVSEGALGSVFPQLQAAAMDSKAVERLFRSVELGLASGWQFGAVLNLSPPAIDAPTHRLLCERLLDLPRGFGVVLSAVALRLYPYANSRLQIPAEVIELGRLALARTPLDSLPRHAEYHLATIAESCLHGPECAGLAGSVSLRVAVELAKFDRNTPSFDRLLKALLRLQPAAVLDAFIGMPLDPFEKPLFQSFSTNRDPNVLDDVDPEVLRNWVAHSPTDRAPYVARAVTVIQRRDSGELAWSPRAETLLSVVEDKMGVLESFERSFHPTRWSGSLTDILTPFRDFTRSLQSNVDPAIAEWGAKQVDKLTNRINREVDHQRPRDESFE